MYESHSYNIKEMNEGDDEYAMKGRFVAKKAVFKDFCQRSRSVYFQQCMCMWTALI